MLRQGLRLRRNLSTFNGLKPSTQSRSFINLMSTRTGKTQFILTKEPITEDPDSELLNINIRGQPVVQYLKKDKSSVVAVDRWFVFWMFVSPLIFGGLGLPLAFIIWRNFWGTLGLFVIFTLCVSLMGVTLESFFPVAYKRFISLFVEQDK